MGSREFIKALNALCALTLVSRCSLLLPAYWLEMLIQLKQPIYSMPNMHIACNLFGLLAQTASQFNELSSMDPLACLACLIRRLRMFVAML